MLEHNAIQELSRRLVRLGYHVFKIDGGILVKLPLLCSVRVLKQDETYRFEPRFGGVSRKAATWQLLLFFAAVCTMSLIATFSRSLASSILFGVLTVPPILLLLLVGCILLFIFEGYRYTITEEFITRAQLMVLEMEKR